METVHFGGCLPVLTYFQPSVVLQLSQKISATEWSPVSRRRCSAGPQPTLTLSHETGRTRHPMGSLCQSSPQNSQRNFRSGELNPPNWEPLPSAPHPFMTSAWDFFLQRRIPVLPRLPTRQLQSKFPNLFATEEAKQRCKASCWLTPSLHRGKSCTHTSTHAQGERWTHTELNR